MTEKMNMSLDEIISSNRGSFRTQHQPNRRNNNTIMRRGGNSPYNRGQRSIGAGGVQKPSIYARDAIYNGWGREYDAYKRHFNAGLNPAASSERTALLVSNLDFGVSDSDIRELFSDFGLLVKAAVHYDRSGRSLGTADVIYERAADAVKAVKQYNGVPLDGRPMNIQYATSQLPQSTLSTYNNTPPYRSYGYRPSAARGLRRIQVRGGTKGVRGGVQNRGGARSEPTAAELDAELDAYVNKMKI